MDKMPEYMKKHPCTNCGDGYIQCAQGLSFNLKCCCACDHPGRWETNQPYTKAELLEMWVGKEMPAHIKRQIDAMPD